MERLRVNLDDHSYYICVGGRLLDEAGRLIREVYSGTRTLIVTDDSVWDLYGDRLKKSLRDAGMQASVFHVAPGEQSKSMRTLESLLMFMAEAGMTRSDLLIAFGGGVIGDLAGFAAATYMRGIDFVQIPTTLLAQVDSGVGGKTAVNLDNGKNLVGAFWQPRLVISDTQLLETLPEREFAGGMAEVIKYGCIFSQEFFGYLAKFRDRETLMRAMPLIVYRCCDFKREVVEEDERDTGRRMLLNFGHTFGHSMEVMGNYTRYTHGEAVALGMLLAVAYGEAIGVTPNDITAALADLLARWGLPVTTDLKPACMAVHMTKDKKADGDRLRLVLLRDMGEAYVETVTREQLRSTMEALS